MIWRASLSACRCAGVRLQQAKGRWQQRLRQAGVRGLERELADVELKLEQATATPQAREQAPEPGVLQRGERRRRQQRIEQSRQDVQTLQNDRDRLGDRLQTAKLDAQQARQALDAIDRELQQTRADRANRQWGEPTRWERNQPTRSTPPASDQVRELIGDPPASGVRFAQRYDRLVDQLERHRIRWQLDIERDGPLGPDPGQIEGAERDRYQRQRAILERQVEAMRQRRGLERAQPDADEREHDRQRQPPSGWQPPERGLER